MEHIDLIIDAKRCMRKILNEVKEMDLYRDEMGLVDGITDIDYINQLATKGYLKLKRFLQAIEQDDEDDE